MGVESGDGFFPEWRPDVSRVTSASLQVQRLSVYGDKVRSEVVAYPDRLVALSRRVDILPLLLSSRSDTATLLIHWVFLPE